MNKRRVEVAVILAAGFGKRLLPHTEVCPKALLCIDNVPLINHILSSLAAARIKHIIFVIGHLGNLIKKYVLTKHFDFTITFVSQDEISGTADALSQAKTELALQYQRYFMVLAADYLLPKTYLKNLIEFHCHGNQNISLSLRVINENKIRESSIVTFGENNAILYINEKPKNTNVLIRPIASSLIYILPNTVFNYIDKIDFSERGEKELPLVINKMISAGITVKGLIQEQLPDWEERYRNF